jgi:hypothetical protein
MAPRLRVTAPLVRLKDPQGRLQEFYSERAVVLPRWATHDTEQVLHHLRLNLVEFCDDAGRPTDSGRQWECLSALIACDVPEDAGRPRAADMLRAEGLAYSNETISKAIALRKSGAKYEAPQ